MEDVQSRPAEVPIRIDSVGIKNLNLPIVVSDRANGSQQTVARIELGVDLPAEFKGTHMSRFVESLAEWDEHLNYSSMKSLLQTIRTRLNAHSAQVRFAFPYFIKKQAPSTQNIGIMNYDCALIGKLPPKTENEAENADAKPIMMLEVEVPVMTVCPCSKAISKEGAHSQRAMVRIHIRMKGFCWLEEFIEMAERSASSPVYSVLKRADEKFVTEDAFAHPCFVEDVVRNVALQLEKHPQVGWFSVEVESFESIHNHSAYARIEKTNAEQK